MGVVDNMSEEYSLMIKFYMMGGIFLIGLAGGTLPLLIVKSVADRSSQKGKEKERSLVEMLNMFASGMFFSSCFLHLLPDAMADLNDVIPASRGFRWACFFTTLGFILILLAEEGINAIFHLNDRLLHAKDGDDAQLDWISDSFPYTSKKCRHSWSFNHSTCKETEPELKSFSPSDTAVEGNLSYHRTQQHPICESSLHHSFSKAPNERKIESNPLLLQPTHYDGLDDNEGSSRSYLSRSHIGNDTKSEGSGNTVGITAIFTLVIALGFHSFVEGLGLGASHTGTSGIFVAIVLHKGLAAFSIGTMLSSFCSNLKVIFSVITFSLMTPLGCGVGMRILVNGQQHHVFEGSWGSGICSALAAGTFLHISLMEIVVRNYVQSPTDRGFKLFCFLLGYSLFSACGMFF
eukprot:393887_1